MAKLSIEQAPTPTTPRLFLLTASAWACAAGVLLLHDGAPVLASRWSGTLLAVVHAFTLGFLGNAMFGSLLQFLPAAAGVRVRGGRSAALLLYGLLNLGTSALVMAFRWPTASPPWWGGALLLAAFALLATLVLPGMLRAAGQRFLRCVLGGAVAAGVVTALLGLCLTFGLSGMASVPLLPLTDVHAAWGLLGWVAALIASVARLVGPMFQGLAVPRERVQGGWHAGVYLVLVAGVIAAFVGMDTWWLRIAVAGAGLAFAAAGVLSQMRARRLRRTPLTGFWAAGWIALAASACLLFARDTQPVLVGVLAIGIGFPLLVVGMQLEIVAFLGWIGLHRHCGKGVRLPGVNLLMPERDKYAVLGLHLVAAVALLAAVVLGSPAGARVAGGALLLCHGATLVALAGVGWRSQRFIRQLQERK